LGGWSEGETSPFLIINSHDTKEQKKIADLNALTLLTLIEAILEM
jgi:hypothetical protein